MKYVKRVAINVAVCVCLISCDHIANTNQDEAYFSIEHKEIKDFSDVGYIERVIKLESSDNSMVGRLDRVKVDADGDIYVLDRFSQKSLFRFDSEGKFLNKYGRRGQGPGEYDSLQGFDVDSSGTVFLLTESKILKFKKSGKYANEKRIDVLGGDIKVVGDELFISTLRYRRGNSRNRNALQVYGLNLNQKKGVFPYDSRLEKYLFLPSRPLDGNESELFLIDTYDLLLRIYVPHRNKSFQIRFPNKNRRLDPIWKKPALDENDKKKIEGTIHRFNDVLSFKGGIFLFDCDRDLNRYSFWLVDRERKKIRIYPYFKLCGLQEAPAKSLTFSYVVGSYGDGLILVLEDCETYQKHRNEYPQLRNISFSIYDNPLIFFLRLRVGE